MLCVMCYVCVACVYVCAVYTHGGMCVLCVTCVWCVYNVCVLCAHTEACVCVCVGLCIRMCIRMCMFAEAGGQVCTLYVLITQWALGSLLYVYDRAKSLNVPFR